MADDDPVHETVGCVRSAWAYPPAPPAQTACLVSVAARNAGDALADQEYFFDDTQGQLLMMVSLQRAAHGLVFTEHGAPAFLLNSNTNA